MYFVFDKMPGPVRWLGRDFLDDYWWDNDIWRDDGAAFKHGLIPEPLRIELQPVRGTWDPGDRMPAYFNDGPMPIFATI